MSKARGFKQAALALGLAGLLAVVPGTAGAKGGGMQSRPGKDFRELIVKGERLEIVACLVAVIDYARHDRSYDAVRWDDAASDRAIVRESQSDGRLTRYVRFTAQMQTHGLFTQSWRPMEISCEQPEDGVVRVSVRPAAG